MTLLATVLSIMSVKSQAQSSDLPLQKLETPNYEVLYIHVPANSLYRIQPVLSHKLDLLPEMMTPVKDKAVAAINAGFFDPSNKLTTSYVIINNKTVANPVNNQRFVENPDLFPYIEKMLNRSEFRVLECNGKRTYDITTHLTKVPNRCKLVHALQAGPNLFDPTAMEGEAFVAYKGKQRVRDPIGVDRKNARSAIGITPEGDAILAMVSMIPTENKVSGVSLSEMSEIMSKLGATKALSLDGGSSSTLWVGGETFYGKLDKSQNRVKRPIKSALVVMREG